MKFEKQSFSVEVYIEFKDENSRDSIYEHLEKLSDEDRSLIEREKYNFYVMDIDETWDTNKPYIRIDIDGDYNKTSPDKIIAELRNEFSQILKKENVRRKKMDFGEAIRALKDGKAVARTGWNGKNMFIVLMPELNLPPYNTQGTERKVNDRTAKWIGEDTPLESQPYIAMKNAQNKWQPGWLASQADMLAEDWEIVDIGK